MSCANFCFLSVSNVIVMMIQYFYYIYLPHVIFPDTGVLSMCIIYSYLLTTLLKTTIIKENIECPL